MKLANKTHHFSKNQLSNLASKWSILQDDLITSEWWSPASELKESLNNNQKIVFASKDSNDSLELLNQNMASKVQLKSRNDAGKDEENARK